MVFRNFTDLNKCVTHCRLCPRLVDFRETAPARSQYADEPYWRKPVPGFGDPSAWLMLVGLAPAPHGGNRTGRIFTGDGSGRFLIPLLYEEGFASQPTSEGRDDGLQLYGCYITAAVKCVPPANKPLPQERFNCSQYLHNEILLLPQITHVLALGKMAYDSVISYLKLTTHVSTKPAFKHGVKLITPVLTLYASYHPSPQNTNTGKLTTEMFRSLLQEIKCSK